MIESIINETKAAFLEITECLSRGDILVVGCSTSEICGDKIGSNSNPEVAEAIVAEVCKIVEQREIYLAAQCCEHLNRALIVEKELAAKLGLEIVSAVPQPKAGGSFATFVYKNMRTPVAVEEIKADAGIDIGDTLIGMHLKRVAVPKRLSVRKIGEANVVAAATRPKFIGGERTKYSD
ncbi:MAG: TIGR01440 family protein [Oscillospiraceae bacterium]